MPPPLPNGPHRPTRWIGRYAAHNKRRHALRDASHTVVATHRSIASRCSVSRPSFRSLILFFILSLRCRCASVPPPGCYAVSLGNDGPEEQSQIAKLVLSARRALVIQPQYLIKPKPRTARELALLLALEMVRHHAKMRENARRALGPSARRTSHARSVGCTPALAARE
jgi:hypothetical protein